MHIRIIKMLLPFILMSPRESSSAVSREERAVAAALGSGLGVKGQVSRALESQSSV